MNQEKAVDIFLQSVVRCERTDPTVPALTDDEQIVCQGPARNRTLDRSRATNDRQVK